MPDGLARLVREARAWVAFMRWLRETAAMGILVACTRCNGTGSLPPRLSSREPWGPEHVVCPDCGASNFQTRRTPNRDDR